MRARATAGLSVFIVALLLCGCAGSPISKALQLGKPRSLPTFSNEAVPRGFVGVVRRCTGKGRFPTPPCFDVLALFSTTNGIEQRTLVRYPLQQQQQSDVGNVGISYPSRGPRGDVWFLLTEPLCRSELYRMDAGTGHVVLVAKRCGFVLSSPVQSPNGRFLAYVLFSGDLNANALIIRDLATGREREVLPVDSHGRAGGRPESVLPVRGTPSFNDGGGPGPSDAPSPDSFVTGVAWSLDSSRVAVRHVAGEEARLCGPPNSCYLYPDRSLDVFDVASLKRLTNIHGQGRCQIQSSAFDSAGLVIAQTCDLHDSDASVVQYAPDLRTQLSETKLDKCALESSVVAGGAQHDAVLISAYDYCPKSAWPGKAPLKAIGPQQLIDVLQDGRLRSVLVYPNGGDGELREVGW